MVDKPTREEVVRVYRVLKATLSIMSGQLSLISLGYHLHDKRAKAAIQAASELFMATSCIKSHSLEGNEKTVFIKMFNAMLGFGNIGVTLQTIKKCIIGFDALIKEITENGHKELAGHLRGTQTYLKRLINLREKLQK